MSGIAVALIASVPDLHVPMSGSAWTLGRPQPTWRSGPWITPSTLRAWSGAVGSTRQNRRKPPSRPGGDGGTGQPQDGYRTPGRHRYLPRRPAGRAAEDRLPWHGRSLRCAAMTCLLIGEQLLHGYDMVQTLGTKWTIEAEPARLVVQACATPSCLRRQRSRQGCQPPTSLPSTAAPCDSPIPRPDSATAPGASTLPRTGASTAASRVIQWPGC